MCCHYTLFFFRLISLSVVFLTWFSLFLLSFSRWKQRTKLSLTQLPIWSEQLYFFAVVAFYSFHQNRPRIAQSFDFIHLETRPIDSCPNILLIFSLLTPNFTAIHLTKWINEPWSLSLSDSFISFHLILIQQRFHLINTHFRVNDRKMIFIIIDSSTETINHRRYQIFETLTIASKTIQTKENEYDTLFTVVSLWSVYVSARKKDVKAT